MESVCLHHTGPLPLVHSTLGSSSRLLRLFILCILPQDPLSQKLCSIHPGKKQGQMCTDFQEWFHRKAYRIPNQSIHFNYCAASIMSTPSSSAHDNPPSQSLSPDPSSSEQEKGTDNGKLRKLNCSNERCCSRGDERWNIVWRIECECIHFFLALCFCCKCESYGLHNQTRRSEKKLVAN